MTKTTILQCIEEMENNLIVLRQAVERMPESVSDTASITPDFEQEDAEVNGDLDAIFATLREFWNIPSDIEVIEPLQKIREAMAADLPENWASREIIRMREE